MTEHELNQLEQLLTRLVDALVTRRAPAALLASAFGPDNGIEFIRKGNRK